MSDVVSFNTILKLKEQNKSFSCELINGFDSEFRKWYFNQKENITKCFKKDNLSFMIKNYELINDHFLSGVVSKNKVSNFIRTLHNQFKENQDEYDKFVISLYFYNIYRIYDDALFSLTDEKIKLLIYIYSAFEDEYKIEDLDKICDFLLDDNIYEELKNICGYENLKYVLTDIVEEYLEDGVKNNIPVSFFAKKMISYYKELDSIISDKKNVNELFKIDPLTIEELCSKIKSQADGIISLMMNGEKTDKSVVMLEEGFYLKSNMDMLMFKLKNINKDEIDDCLLNIKKIWESDDYLINKLRSIFDYVNSFDYTSVKK